jgi:outer membrane receptor protein involved in Fe transport
MTIKSIPVLPGASIQGSIAWTRATFETHATLAAPFLEEEEEETPDQILPAPVVEPGDRFPLIPAFTAGLAISYGRGEYQSDLSLHYVGERFLVGDEGNKGNFGKLAGYALLNLDISRVVGPATLYAEVKNLLDQSYNPFGLISPNVRGPSEEIEPFFTPGLPRRMLIGARLRLH